MPYGHFHFGLFFPTLSDLAAFSRAVCGLAINGHHPDIFIYAEADSSGAFISTNICVLHYQTGSSAIAIVDLMASPWLSHLPGPPDVFISLTAEGVFTACLLRVIRGS
jgi:hypothetical protein